MGRKLQDWVKPGRKKIAEWDRVLGPIAENHPGPNELAVNRYAFVNHGTEVTYDNQFAHSSSDFSLIVRYLGAKEPIGQIIYSRKVAPYFEDTQANLNVCVCADLANTVARCARSIGLNGALDHDGRVLGHSPAVSFGGEFRDDDFERVAELTRMAEALIDFRLLEVDQTMERPFHYAVFDKPEDCLRDVRYIEKIHWVSDLSDAVGVLVLAREIDRPLGHEKARTYSNALLIEIAERNHGKVMTPDEFVQSK